MASGSLTSRSSVIKYNPGAGVVTYQLRVPLQAVSPGIHHTAQWKAESLDGSAREVLAVGSGIPLVRGLIRYEDEPDELFALIRAGQNGTQLDWYPRFIAQPATFYACWLHKPDAGEDWTTDRDPRTLREQQIEIMLARTDASDFPAAVFD